MKRKRIEKKRAEALERPARMKQTKGLVSFMSNVAHAPSPVQTMPDTHDPDLLGWTGGPLPNADLEHIAWLLFGFRYPQVQYDSSLFSDERNDCRRLALKLRIKFVKMDRWTLSNAAEKLTDEFMQLFYGDRAMGSSTRDQVQDYAESCLEDGAKTFCADLRPNPTRSWGHVPEDDEDGSSLEDLGPSKARVS